jgi:hypothetical protein
MCVAYYERATTVVLVLAHLQAAVKDQIKIHCACGVFRRAVSKDSYIPCRISASFYAWQQLKLGPSRSRMLHQSSYYAFLITTTIFLPLLDDLATAVSNKRKARCPFIEEDQIFAILYVLLLVCSVRLGPFDLHRQKDL